MSAISLSGTVMAPLSKHWLWNPMSPWLERSVSIKKLLIKISKQCNDGMLARVWSKIEENIQRAMIDQVLT